MAVASQSPLARVRLSLQVAGLAGLFGEHIYVTSMVARPKPAPDIYLLAAGSLEPRPRIAWSSRIRPAGAAAALGARNARHRLRAGRHRRPRCSASGARVIRSMDELIAAIELLSEPVPRPPTCGFFLQADFLLRACRLPSDARVANACSPTARRRSAAPDWRRSQTNNKREYHESESDVRGARVVWRLVVRMRGRWWR